MSQMPNQQAAPQQAPKTTVSIGNWILTMILSCIPIVGFICLLVWAISGNTIKSKKNWAIATLILAAIGVVLSIILWSSLMALFSTLSGSASF